MNIIIIEDERLTAADLQATIESIDNSLVVVKIIKSIEEGIFYFKKHVEVDLIFSDIRLGDGLSFEILGPLQIPVIFCTAYDEYALTAFKANGIDYILKPFTDKEVRLAIDKFKQLKGNQTENIQQQYEALSEIFKYSAPKPASLLIRLRDKIIPIKFEQFALFYLENNIVNAVTFDSETYHPSKTLDELEQMAGDAFFRVNRQYLIHRNVVKHASNILSRKLSISINIPHAADILISREKSPQFLKWLSGDL
ncbi:LytR/AlgR family response regulator transcription factor [Rhizosphaericola mali]|uniref:Response regulator transcription factor n=1 Tax=Rhizosphaericola mali TaxID=2545455 RepID=A0A5P2G3R3_9BACT|nr:LytTR family DNA-binding domain-containing protein [Rhizosphaericola mali]QES88450.1 response regulator transcription factor [Rhizosphaericola mali]